MSRRKKTHIELILKTLGYATTRRRLMQIERSLTKVRKNVKRFGEVGRKALMGLGFAFKKLGKGVKAPLATMRSALLRTFAYGIITAFRNSIMGVTKAIQEGARTSLLLGRASAILTQNTNSAEQTKTAYDGLVSTITNTKDASFLLTKELAKVNFVLAIAGVRGKAFTTTLTLIDKMAAITGESANSLTMDFVRLTNAFQIGETQFSRAADVLVTGISNAVMLMPDLLNSVKMLGPTWVMAFGGGVESLKQFTSAVGALSQVGLKGGQGARYLNRMILGLLAPTQEAASLMYGLGVDIYQATKKSAPMASALKKVNKEIAIMKIREQDLLRIRAQSIAAGGDAVEINEKIAQVQAKMGAKQSIVAQQYSDFVEAGGKLRPMNTILVEFAGAVERMEGNSLKMFESFKKLWQLRGMRASTLITNIKEWNKLQKAMTTSEGALDRIAKKVDQSWGMTLTKLQTTISKIVTIITESLGAPIVDKIAEGLGQDVLKPLLDAFQDDDIWMKIRDHWTKKMDELINLKPVGQFLKLKIMGPDALGLSPKEYERQMIEVTDAMTAAFEPFKKHMLAVFENIAAATAKIFVLELGKGILKGILGLLGTFWKVSFAIGDSLQRGVKKMFGQEFDDNGKRKKHKEGLVSANISSPTVDSEQAIFNKFIARRKEANWQSSKEVEYPKIDTAERIRKGDEALLRTEVEALNREMADPNSSNKMAVEAFKNIRNYLQKNREEADKGYKKEESFMRIDGREVY